MNATVENLATQLVGLAENTPETPHTVVLNASVINGISDTSGFDIWYDMNRMVQDAGKYIVLDLSPADNLKILWTYRQIDKNQENQYIKGIVLPNNLTSIDYRAFEGCTGLTSVTIPGSVTSIEERAFSSCRGLTSVTFGPGSNINDDSHFGDHAFPTSDGGGANGLRTAYFAANPKNGA